MAAGDSDFEIVDGIIEETYREGHEPDVEVVVPHIVTGYVTGIITDPDTGDQAVTLQLTSSRGATIMLAFEPKVGLSLATGLVATLDRLRGA
jgi:hypothetical protein